MTTITDSDCVVFWLLTNTGITWSKEPEVWWSWTLEGEDSLCEAYSSSHIKDNAGRGFGADLCCSAVQQLISSWLPLWISYFVLLMFWLSKLGLQSGIYRSWVTRIKHLSQSDGNSLFFAAFLIFSFHFRDRFTIEVRCFLSISIELFDKILFYFNWYSALLSLHCGCCISLAFPADKRQSKVSWIYYSISCKKKE